MFIPHGLRDPHQGRGVEAPGVGQKLAKMVVVCRSKLILDNYIRPGSKIPGEDVH